MAGRLVDYIGSGVAASLPTAATVHAALTTGAAGFYYATDTRVLYSLNRSGTPAWNVVTGNRWQMLDTSGAPTTTPSWTYSSAVANVDFINLDPYNELLLFFRNVTCSVTGQRAIRVSVNNGSSYYSTSGDYVFMNSDGTDSNSGGIPVHASTSTLARSGSVQINGCNVTGAIKQFETPTRVDFAGGYFVASTSPINAIRAFINAGGASNLTGGSIYLFGR